MSYIRFVCTTFLVYSKYILYVFRIYCICKLVIYMFYNSSIRKEIEVTYCLIWATIFRLKLAFISSII